MNRRRALVTSAVLALALVVTAAGSARPDASLAVNGIVISQVYGGGGNSGSTYTNDFIELFNPTDGDLPLAGSSVQYASATGTTWQVTALTGTLAAHHYYLVQEAQGAGGTTPLPAPDATGTIAMSATAGKVALVNQTTALSGTCPSTVDVVGFGSTASCSEASPAPAPTNTTADIRANGGCTDTGNNSADFATGAPTPRNSASTAHSCGVVTNAQPTIVCPSNVTVDQGTAWSRSVSASDADGTVTSFTVSPTSGFSISNVAPAAAPGGTATATVNGDSSVAPGSYTVQVGAANDDTPAQSASCTFSVTVNAVLTTIPIGTVQGSVPDSADGTTFHSPYNGQRVKVQGVVTELTHEGANNGFYLQNTDTEADSDPSSSDGVFVFMGTFTSLIGGYVPKVGDDIQLTATVNEFFDQTELQSASATKVGSGAVTPFVAAPPADAAGAARYWERHEGMQAGVPAGSIVNSPTHFFASTNDTEFYVVPPSAPIAQRANPYAQRTFRDAHPLDGSDQKIDITDEGIKAIDPNAQLIPVHTLQKLGAPVTGGVYYDFGKYSVSASAQPTVVDGADPSQNDAPPTFDRSQAYSVANFNMENLYDYRDDPNDGCDFDGNSGCPGVSPPFDYTPASDAEYQGREAEIAHQIVNDLHSPDVIVVAEAEDQDICSVTNGAMDCGSADNADGRPDDLEELALHIKAIGGPDYSTAFDRSSADARGIIPAFMYRTDRVSLLAADPGDAVLGSAPTVQYRGAPLAYNSDVSNPKSLNAVLPSDIETPNDTDGSNVFTRAVQVGHFRISPPSGVAGSPSDVWILANHFSSGPDSRVGQRREQANYNAAVVKAIQGEEPDAKVMVAGDLNDYPRPDDPFLPARNSDQLVGLYDAGLHDLYDTVLNRDPAAAYSYVFDGNAQDLDHQFVTDSWFDDLRTVNEAHINSDWPRVAGSNRGTSDHDPMVSQWSLKLDSAPTVDAGGPYSVDEAGTVSLSASADDPDHDAVQYAWDLDGDGVFETQGQTVVFHAGDGPASPTVTVKATDSFGLSSTDTATVTVANVAPTATFSASGAVTAGGDATLSLTDPHDVSPADEAAGFTYAFDCGDGAGYGAFSSASTASCPAPARGTLAVGGEIRDKDGGVREYRSSVTVNGRSPVVSAGGPYSVDEGGTVTLSATGSDPDGDSITYAWDLDGDGVYETPGQSVTYHAGDGPATKTVSVQATDSTGATASSSATVTIRNAAPTATFHAPASATVGLPFTISLTNPHDASADDQSAGFTYAFDCGDGTGYSPFGPAASATCRSLAFGTVTVRGAVRDKDGGTSEYSAKVDVGVTFAGICAVVQQYAATPKAAKAICGLLAKAEADAAKGHRLQEKADLLAASAAVVVETALHQLTPQEGAALLKLIARL